MKIIHTSDLHLESAMSKFSPIKAKERAQELFLTFERMADEGAREGVSVIIIAGDMFDSEKYSKRSRDRALGIIKRHPDIDFLYLIGNHESGSFVKDGLDLPHNLKVFGKEWTYFNYGDVTIAGKSEAVGNVFTGLELEESRKNIVVLHGAVKDSAGEGEGISLPLARGRNIDYLALGHYHTYTEYSLDKRGVAVYSGTPEGRGFDETGEKGYMVIDTTPTLKYSLRPFARRRLHTIPLDLSGVVRTAEIAERAERALRNIPSTDIVRLELVGRYFPTLWKDVDSLVGAYENRFYYFEVKDSSRIAINPEDYRNDKSLKGEFIRTVASDDSLDEETKEKIIACGINALMGEELFDR